MDGDERRRDIAPHRVMQPLEPGAVRWTRGFWASRFEKNRLVTIPSMRQAMDIPHNGAVFSNLYVAAGLQEGEHDGTNWSDGDCYKWMEAVTHTYAITRDPELDATLDDLIEVVAVPRPRTATSAPRRSSTPPKSAGAPADTTSCTTWAT